MVIASKYIIVSPNSVKNFVKNFVENDMLLLANINMVLSQIAVRMDMLRATNILQNIVIFVRLEKLSIGHGCPRQNAIQKKVLHM